MVSASVSPNAIGIYTCERIGTEVAVAVGDAVCVAVALSGGGYPPIIPAGFDTPPVVVVRLGVCVRLDVAVRLGV